MFTPIFMRTAAERSIIAHKNQIFNAMAVKRFISQYAYAHIEHAWNNSEKRELAEALTRGTTVHGHHPEQLPVYPEHIIKKGFHSSAKLILGKTYGIQNDATDKIPFHCASEGILMRLSILIPRCPSAEVRAATNEIAEALGQSLKGVDKKTFDSIFEVGANKAETRSLELIENHARFMSLLTDRENVPYQQLLRALESILSPMGMIANGHGGTHCKIARAKASGKDIGQLDDFMKDLMVDFKPFYVPYIKAPGSPFENLKFHDYRMGGVLSPRDLRTESQFLECVGEVGKPVRFPQLRDPVVIDNERTLVIHDRMSLAHFFDVSGTTGALMQAALGLLQRAGKGHLADTPEKIEALGMVLAGCNYHKSGFHTLHEVLPALSWVIHKVLPNQPYMQRTPHELIEDVGKVLVRCVDQPNSKLTQLVGPAIAVVNENALIHYEAYKEDVKAKLALQEKKEQFSALTLGGGSEE